MRAAPAGTVPTTLLRRFPRSQVYGLKDNFPGKGRAEQAWGSVRWVPAPLDQTLSSGPRTPLPVAGMLGADGWQCPFSRESLPTDMWCLALEVASPQGRVSVWYKGTDPHLWVLVMWQSLPEATGDLLLCLPPCTWGVRTLPGTLWAATPCTWAPCLKEDTLAGPCRWPGDWHFLFKKEVSRKIIMMINIHTRARKSSVRIPDLRSVAVWPGVSPLTSVTSILL